MTIDDKIRGEKLQYDIKEKSKKYQHYHLEKFTNANILTDEDILPSEQSRITEQTKFTYSPLGKAFEKQIKTIEEQEKKQIKVLKVLKPEENKEEEIKSVEGLFPKEMRINEIKNDKDDIKKPEELIQRKDLKYETI